MGSSNEIYCIDEILEIDLLENKDLTADKYLHYTGNQ